MSSDNARVVRHYCTYFDSRYLARGLALYESLRSHSPSFALHVLCLDDAASDYLASSDLPGIHPIRLADLEAEDVELLESRATRSLVEYYFTCTSALLLNILRGCNQLEGVTYLDADLLFYSDPEPIYAEIGDGSVGIIEHRFSSEYSRLEMYGRYNVGFLYFRNDATGIACLEWWRRKCIEWCYDRVESGRFADQKYLDEWPSLFDGVVNLQNPGAGSAPWNQQRYPITWDGNRLFAGGKPLVFYHFHGLRLESAGVVVTGLSDYGYRLTSPLKHKVYAPYVRSIRRLGNQTRKHVARGAEIRYPTRGRAAELAKCIVDGRALFVVGPFVFDSRFASIVQPAVRLWSTLLRRRSQK